MAAIGYSKRAILVAALVAFCFAVAVLMLFKDRSPNPSAPSRAPINVNLASVCQVGSGTLTGKTVRVRAKLVVDGDGGVLSDDRCPGIEVGFWDNLQDTEVPTDRKYIEFSSQIDTPLLSTGLAITEVDFFGVVRATSLEETKGRYRVAIELRSINDYSAFRGADAKLAKLPRH